ncbi:hypothetical protein SeLEV6574_g02769 [Synchytrium endobioticum]|uniref:NodB homology domain-containing protein n=1 Tax=Synchytrium endobioticum TaxID=286115 RepID=A0A507D7G1_9FUNG|nr:hypothetical protein SeLEV6574_g02769 [Synchytrium endobioticum]
MYQISSIKGRRSPALLLILCTTALVLLVSFAVPAQAQLRSGYRCDPNACKAPTCKCPSTQAPWNPTSTKLPMLATLTFDDAINSVVLPSILGTLGNHTNPNGCPLSATFFVSTQYTDFSLVQQFYAAGHEIAVHTVHHYSDPSSDEIESALTAISKWAGIPQSKIRGFRTPFLNYTTSTFQSLLANGHFLYDSSMPTGAVPVWPHTLDNGFALDCVTGTCDPTAKFPGLWEVAMSDLLNPDGTLNASMDPEGSSSGIVNLLKSNFIRHYQDPNRVPFGLYIHAASGTVDPTRIQAYSEFISWTQATYPDVYWINNQQLLSFMTTPPPTDSSPHPSLGCTIYLPSPSNSEICDGRSNTGTSDFSTIDSNLLSSCYFTVTQSSTQTCFGCPSNFPNTTGSGIGPVPPRDSSTRAFVPDLGCPGTGVWDPIAAKCVDLPVLVIGNGAILGGLNMTGPNAVPRSNASGTTAPGTTAPGATAPSAAAPGTNGGKVSTSASSASSATSSLQLSWAVIMNIAVIVICLMSS